MTLGGSCGGKEVSLDGLYGFSVDSLSTGFRALTQGGIEHFLKTEEKTPYHFEHKSNHHCNKCGIGGESVRLGPCDVCESCQTKFDKGEYS